MAQDEWDMVNRFYGFRYEMTFSPGTDTAFDEQIKAYADENRCFGWVQTPADRKFVGEVRCTKKTGLAFHVWMQELADRMADAKLELRVYEDSKIRLHFTHFKVLDQRRDTCFLDSPHRCATPTSENDEL